MFEWEHHPPDTWAVDTGEYMALMKQLEPDRFVYVVGTLVDADLSGHEVSLANARAVCNRYMWAVNNIAPESRAKLNDWL